MRRSALRRGLATFRSVLRPACDVPHGLAETDCVQRCHVARPHRHLLHGSLGQRRPAEKTPSQRIGLVEQGVMRDDPPNETNCESSLGIDALPREQQLHRIGPIDSLRKAYRCHDCRYAEERLGKTELGSVTRDDEVAPAGKRQPITQAVPVDSSNDRLEDLPSAFERIERRLLPERAGELSRGASAVTQVRADAEGPSRTGDDGHPCFLVVTKTREGVIEVAPHLGVDGVENVGSVVGDGGHMAIKSERG